MQSLYLLLVFVLIEVPFRILYEQILNLLIDSQQFQSFNAVEFSVSMEPDRCGQK